MKKLVGLLVLAAGVASGQGVSSILGTTGNNPSGITIDSGGNVYTANRWSNNVTQITPGGVSSILGTTGNNPSPLPDAYLDYPRLKT